MPLQKGFREEENGNTQAQKEDNIQQEDKRCEVDVKLNGKCIGITESNRMVCSPLQGNVNDDEGGADMGIVENVDQIEMQEEEQDIIPPYF